MPTLYITAPEADAAELAEQLVTERLAACVNRLPVRSTFRWEGEVVTEDEQLLLAKTTEERADDVVERVRELHPYDVPCVERFDEDDVLDAFETWIAESVE